MRRETKCETGYMCSLFNFQITDGKMSIYKKNMYGLYKEIYMQR